MKLVTFIADGGTGDRVGALVDGDARIVDLARADGDPAAPFGRMLDLIEAGDAGLARARAAVAGAKPEAMLGDRRAQRHPCRRRSAISCASRST